MEHINQREFVSEHLKDMPRKDWARIALDADVSLRTIYTTVDPHRKPTYDTVYRIYVALLAFLAANAKPARAAKSAKKAGAK